MLLYEQEECYMKLKNTDRRYTHNHLSCDGEISILVINFFLNKIDTLINLYVCQIRALNKVFF